MSKTRSDGGEISTYSPRMFLSLAWPVHHLKVRIPEGMFKSTLWKLERLSLFGSPAHRAWFCHGGCRWLPTYVLTGAFSQVPILRASCRELMIGGANVYETIESKFIEEKVAVRLPVSESRLVATGTIPKPPAFCGVSGASSTDAVALSTSDPCSIWMLQRGSVSCLPRKGPECHS